jgi:hypothetical protein
MMIRASLATGLVLLSTACGETVEAEATDATPRATAATPSQAPGSPADADGEAQIMRALGFARGDDGWYDPDCDGSYAALDDLADLNGDGRVDAVVQEDGDQCHGFNQRVVSIHTPTGSGWKEIVSFQSTFIAYSFHKRPGIEWPDIEYFPGMTGEQAADGSIQAAECVTFLRWDGRDYVEGGTSRNGKICALAPRFAKSSTGESASFPPIPKGFYAYGRSCAAAIASGSSDEPPIGLVYFDEKSMREFDGGREIQGFERLGDNRFRVKARWFGNGDDAVGTQGDFVIRVTGTSTFVNEDDGAVHTHCPISSVPRAIQVDWYYL